jgi:RNA polymerase sigma factor (sigma-70 family)
MSAGRHAASPASQASIDSLLAHAGWLNRLARHLVKDGDVAQDVAQEVWLAARRAPPEAGRPARPWLAQVLRNAVRMRARGEGRRQRWEAEAGAETARSAASPETIHEQLELHRVVVESVMKLEEPLRATLLLRYFEERSSFEIARLMGVPAGTVRRRLKMAVAELRAELDRRFGNRRRWALALAPGARWLRTGGVTKGAIVMATKHKLGVVAVLLLAALLGGSVWLYHPAAGGGQPAAGEGSPRPVVAVAPWRVGDDQGRARASVEGRVEDHLGRAVSAAVVVLVRELAEPTARPLRPAAVVVCDAAGRFGAGDLPPGNYVATAAAPAGADGPGRSTVFRLANGRTEHIRIVLAATGHVVEGQVLDAGGGPIAGAHLLATPGTPYALVRGPSPLFQAVTDGGGRYRLLLGVGEFRLRAQAAGYAPVEEPLAASRSLTHDFRLHPAARVAGQVVERETRRPVAGADVRLAPLGRGAESGFRQVLSDDEGRFLFDDAEGGSYQIVARRGPLSGRAPPVHMVEAQAVTGVEIALDPQVSVTGTVVDEHGAGVAAAPVLLFNIEGTPTNALTTTSHRDGTFQIEGVPPGTYGVRVESAESAMSLRVEPVRVGAAEVRGLRIVVRRGTTVVGTVLAAGAPVADAEVHLQAREGTMVMRPTTSAVDGSFRMPGAPAGKLVLIARHPELGLGRAEVSTGQGGEVAVTLQLHPAGASIGGLVKATDGTPVESASVAVTGQGPGLFYGSASTGPDGRFLIGALLPGRYTVWARPRGGPHNLSTSAERPDLKIVQLREGEARTVELTAPSGDRRIAGTVRLPDGKPAAGATVVANPEAGERSWKPDGIMATDSAIAGPDGRFSIEGLGGGVYRLWASRPGYPDAVVEEVAAGRTDLVIRLEAPAAVAGTVVDQAGRPVSLYTIAIAQAPRPGESRAQRFRRTDEGTLPPLPVHDPSGAFAIDGLAAGAYELKVTTPAGSVANQGVALGVGETKVGVRVVVEVGARIAGRVVEVDSGAPIAGALIEGRIAGRMVTATTTGDGSFELADLAPTDHLQLEVRVLDDEELVAEAREVRVPAGGATVELGTITLLRANGRWLDRVRDGVGLDFVAAPTGDGVAVTQVWPGSAAEKAGLTVGDVIRSVDGRDATRLGPGALSYLVHGAPGGAVALGVQSPGGEPRVVTAVRLPPPAAK